MDLGIIISKEYFSLFGYLLLFVFVLTNKKMERYDKILFFSLVIGGVLEIIIFEIEHYFGNLSYRTFMRSALSVIGYILRPSLILILIFLVDKNLRTKTRILLLLIPLFLCTICVTSTFYSHLCFWFTENNAFQRGIFAYVPHIVCLFYTFVCLIVTCRLLKKRDRIDVLVLIAAALCPVFAILIDYIVQSTDISRSSIMLCTLAIYIQSYSITLNKMIDEIPGAVAIFKVTDDYIKVVSFNEVLCNMFGKTYSEFKTLTKDEPFPLLDEKSRETIKNSIYSLKEKDEYSLRLKLMIFDEEKHFNVTFKVSKRQEDSFIIYGTMIDVTREALIYEELSIKNDEISLMMNQLGKIICVYDIPSRTLSMSEKYANIRGYNSTKVFAPNESIEKNLIAADYQEAYKEFYEKIFAGEHSGNMIAKFIDSNGKERWESSNFVVVATKDDMPIRAIISIDDITETYQEKLLLGKYKSTLDSLMGDNKYCLLFDITDNEILAYEGGLLPRDFSFDNKTFEEVVDYFVLKNVKEQDQEIVRELYDIDNMIASYKSGVLHRHIERIIKMSDGSEHWVRLGINLDTTNDMKVLATILCEDIDEEYRKYNILIARANYDYLTGVLTREATMDEIEQYLANEGAEGCHALIMMDMDNLKAINDNLGHQYGDEALQNFAQKVKDFIRENDIIGRIGGDEFFVFIKNISSSVLKGRMQELIKSLEKSYYHNESVITVTASAGISMYYGDKEPRKTLNEMYSQADFALYNSKVNGKNTFRFYRD